VGVGRELVEKNGDGSWELGVGGKWDPLERETEREIELQGSSC
jgi:hypothetical protein